MLQQLGDNVSARALEWRGQDCIKATRLPGKLCKYYPFHGSPAIIECPNYFGKSGQREGVTVREWV